MTAFLQECYAGLRAYPVWRALAVLDMRMRFRRSYFGVAWMVISQLVFALGAGALWSSIFHLDAASFIPQLAIGLAVWGFIAGLLVEGCGTFPTAAGYLRQLPLPRMLFIFRVVMVQACFMGIGLLTGIGVMTALGVPPGFGMIVALPGIILVCVLGVLVTSSIAFLGARYRDLQHGLSMILQMLFVVTPILYPPQMLIDRGLGWALHLNPLTAVIEVIRHPLLQGEFAPLIHYEIVGGLILFSALLAWIIMGFLGRKMIFWL